MNILQHSPYIDDKELPNVLLDKSDHFNILSLNIQSINAKFDQLQLMLRNLHEQNCEFSAICLQETWLSDSSDISHLLLDNYNLITQGERISSHSGLGIYLHKKFSYWKVPIEDTSYIISGRDNLLK